MIFKNGIYAFFNLYYPPQHHSSLYVVEVQEILLSFKWYIQELKEKEAEEERKLSAFHNSKCSVNNTMSHQ